MAFNHYAEQVVADVATGRSLANQPVKLLDFETDAPVDAYINGEVTLLGSGANGLVSPFQTLDTTRGVKMIVGNTEYTQWCREIVIKAANELALRVTNIKVIDGKYYIVDGANDAKIIAVDGSYFVEEI